MRERGTAITLHERAWPVDRQFKRWRLPAQSLLPIFHLAIQPLTLQPLALPDGEVSVLHGQLRQFRTSPRSEGFVSRTQLLEEHTDGPAIRNDVVH